MDLAALTSSTTVRLGRRLSARLVQPQGQSRGQAPGAYPVVAFGHGFVQGTGRYSSVLTDLAARGYVVIAPTSQRGPLPRHGRLADDLVHAIRWARSNLPEPHPHLSAVAGHSMGGGAALLAAARDPSIDAVATFAAAQTRPSATAAAAEIGVPALFVVGDQDRIVPASSTRRLFAATRPPATRVSVRGGFHCGFLDSTSFFGLGCDSGTITRSEQLAITRRVLGDWLDATLKGRPARSWPIGVDIENR